MLARKKISKIPDKEYLRTLHGSPGIAVSCQLGMFANAEESPTIEVLDRAKIETNVDGAAIDNDSTLILAVHEVHLCTTNGKRHSLPGERRSHSRDGQ